MENLSLAPQAKAPYVGPVRWAAHPPDSSHAPLTGLGPTTQPQGLRSLPPVRAQDQT